jgi:uncharacterized delta-60 repeat protein
MSQQISLNKTTKINLSVKFLSILFVFLFAAVSAKAAGEVDPSFNPVVQKVGGSGRVIAVQPDGKILVGGNFTVANRVERSGIARFNTDGSLDTSFNPNADIIGAFYGGVVNAIKIQPDGKILIGGSFTSVGDALHKSIARLNADGTIDNTFVTETFVTGGINGTVNDIEIRSDGKIFAAGTFTYDDSGNTKFRNVALFNPNGSPDTSFYYDGPDGVMDLAVLPDNRILVGGSVFLQRRSANGTGEFGYTINGAVNSIVVLPNGEILIGGGFTQYNGFSQGKIAKITLDGLLNASFNQNGAGFDNTVSRIALAPDGKIVVGGVFNTFNGINRRRVARLNADGSLDTNFNYVPTENNTNVWDVKVQSDGKVIVSDSLSPAGTVTNRRDVKRLNTDGSLDASFNSPGGANNTVETIAVQPDGKIVIGGMFTAVNGANRGYLARLNGDGSLDNGFVANANYFVHSVALQADGRIVVGGEFTVLNNTPRRRYARVNSDGSLDTLFNVGSGANIYVYDVALQTDGAILLGGNFTRVNNNSRIGVARLLNSATARRTLFDFDGDGRADFAVFRPSNSTWYILNSSNNSFTAAQFGAAGDLIAPADYDGDGRTDIAVFRENVPGAGGRAYFYIQQSSSNSFRPEQFGAVGDKPVAADFDGDGKADLAVYRDGSLTGGQSYFFYRPSSQPGVDFRTIAWGVTGDKPAPADYDGDGRQDAAVFRPSNGTWYISRSSDNQILPIRFGLAEDVPTPADFNGDSRAEVAVFRPSTATWYTSTDPATNYGAMRWGVSTDIPVAADYDGDGRADIAVFRPESGNWYVLRSTSGFLGIQWGTTNDKPAPAASFGN